MDICGVERKMAIREKGNEYTWHKNNNEYKWSRKK